MKSFFCIFICIFFFSVITFSQVTWQQTSYSSGVPVNKILATGNGSLFIATNGAGVLQSQSFGNTWTFANTGITDLMIKSIGYKSDSIFFAGAKNHVVYVSTDSTAVWSPFDMNGTGTVITSFCTMPNGDVYAGQAADGIFRTTDNGQSWQEVGLCCAGVLSIVANSAGTIFAGTNAGGVYRSNNGTAWDDVNAGLGSLKINALAINNSGVLFAGTDNGVYRSYDNGDNWITANYGITTLTINDISIKPNGHIFVSTNGGGIFLSKDNGNIWEAINTGLSSLNINCLGMDSSGYVYAASSDTLLFRSEIPYSGLEDHTETGILFRNFPNPFSSSTTIEFDIHESAFCDLTIYDISGVRLQTLLSGELTKGKHVCIWDASSFSPGLYLCEIKTDKEFSRIFLTFVK
jgi:photosystem II stability/assembly factor-like uncharacterized protein